MPATKSVQDTIIELLTEQLIVDQTEVTLNSDLKEDLGADSLDVVETGVRLEEAFDIQIDDRDGDSMKLVSDVISIVEKKLKEKANGNLPR